jgi:type IV secretion system protein VirB1
MIPLSFISKCVVAGVSALTVQKIITVESMGDYLAINVNTQKVHFALPQSKYEAVKTASHFLKRGFNLDLGLMQINSNNLSKYNLNIRDAFDPCKNINVGSRILKDSFSRAAVKFKSHGQDTLMAALSAYNSGNFRTGFSNGYVKKYYPNLNIKNETQSLISNKLSTTKDEIHNLWIAKPVHNQELVYKTNGLSNYISPMKSAKDFIDTPPSPPPGSSNFTAHN